MPGVNGHSPKAYLSGSWKDWNAVQGNLSGTWRLASDVYVKDGGTWKQVWVRLTAPTSGTSSIFHVTATISWTAGVGQEGFKLYRNGTFVKNVTSGTSTTDVVPAMQTDYAYTVSAYAGATETAQIACGTVRAEVGSTTASSSIITNWGYVNDSWNGNQIVFGSSCVAVSNATGYERFLRWEFPTDIQSFLTDYGATNTSSYGLSQDYTAYTQWRAYVDHNSVRYYGAWSNQSNVTAGRPQIRTARTDDYSFEAWADQERYTVPGIGTFSTFSTNYNAVSAIVDSYQFRNLSVTFASQITSATRSIVITRPGTNVTLSGTPYVSNGWDSSVYTNYADATYRVDPQGSGWFNFNSSSKLTGTIRFNIRFISQAAVAYSIP
jgi:hypothetical protein